MSDRKISQNIVANKINELDVLQIQNGEGTALIALQGAHVIEYAPAGELNILFVSDAETYQKGQPIRGGIPVCWPWFGPHKAGLGQHGLVRNIEWSFSVLSDDEARTEIQFWVELDGTDAAFPYKARAELLVSVGKSLNITLTTINLDEQPFFISQALHSYFNCADISYVRLNGLQGYKFFNSLNGETRIFPDNFIFSQETDGIVIDKGQPITLTGLAPKLESGQKSIALTREGSKSVVVWNPWIEKSKGLSQFNNSDYLKMFCVETGNVAEDCREVYPGKKHRMSLILSTRSDV